MVTGLKRVCTFTAHCSCCTNCETVEEVFQDFAVEKFENQGWSFVGRTNNCPIPYCPSCKVHYEAAIRSFGPANAW